LNLSGAFEVDLSLTWATASSSSVASALEKRCKNVELCAEEHLRHSGITALVLL
jgi:hypothetical protein